MNTDTDRVYLSVEEAIAMLPEGEYIHTFRQSGSGILLGADWSRDEITNLLNHHGPAELSGETATAMKHGMVIFDGAGPVFIATK